MTHAQKTALNYLVKAAIQALAALKAAGYITTAGQLALALADVQEQFPEAA